MIVNRYLCERYIKQCDFIRGLDKYYRHVISMRDLSVLSFAPGRIKELDARLMVIKRVRRALDRGVTAIQRGNLTPVDKTVVLPTGFLYTPKDYIQYVIEKELHRYL